jgi:hypothetical protein
MVITRIKETIISKEIESLIIKGSNNKDSTVVAWDLTIQHQLTSHHIKTILACREASLQIVEVNSISIQMKIDNHHLAITKEVINRPIKRLHTTVPELEQDQEQELKIKEDNTKEDKIADKQEIQITVNRRHQHGTSTSTRTIL